MPKILLVDDDESFRKLLRLALAYVGYDVSEARNGREALTVFRREQPDLVMMDIIMPDKEGLDTICELRQNGSQVKIIAMSGGGSFFGPDYLKMAKRFGANDVLVKPFSQEVMVARVESLLGPFEASKISSPR